jgi:uncharacterized membrane protein
MQYNDDPFDRMRDDPDNYKLFVFYYNLKDTRVFVPKRFRRMGWTLNFANPYSYLILLGIAVFAFLMSKVSSM